MEVPEKEHLKRAWRKECLPHVVQNVIIGGLLWGLGSTIIVLLVTKKNLFSEVSSNQSKSSLHFHGNSRGRDCFWRTGNN